MARFNLHLLSVSLGSTILRVAIVSFLLFLTTFSRIHHANSPVPATTVSPLTGKPPNNSVNTTAVGGMAPFVMMPNTGPVTSVAVNPVSMAAPMDPYQVSQTTPPLFDPATGLYTHPQNMFVPQGRPATNQTLPPQVQQQYYMNPQQPTAPQQWSSQQQQPPPTQQQPPPPQQQQQQQQPQPQQSPITSQPPQQQQQQPFSMPYQHSSDRPLQLTQPPSIPNNPVYGMPATPMADSSSVLKTCLDHFASNEKLKYSVLLPGEVFARLVSEYIPLYEPLANAVGSLAARSLSQQQLVYLQAAVDFKIKSLNLLRQDLVYQGVSESSLLCMLILGNVEMNDLNIDAWSQHLDGAAKAASEILARNNVLEKPENFANFMLIFDALTFQDIFSRIALNKRPRLYDIYRNTWRSAHQQPDTKTNPYNALKPIAMELNEILCLAAELHETYPMQHTLGMKYPANYAVDKSYFTPEIQRRYNNLYDAIANIAIPTDADPEIVMLMLTSVPALLIYFMLRLDSHEFLYTVSPRLEKARSDGLNALLRCPPSKFMSIQQPVNIYVIGLICDAPQDRNALLNKIKEFYTEVPRSSLYSIMNFLSNLWKMRDSPKFKNVTMRDTLSSVIDQTGFTVIL